LKNFNSNTTKLNFIVDKIDGSICLNTATLKKFINKGITGKFSYNIYYLKEKQLILTIKFLPCVLGESLTEKFVC